MTFLTFSLLLACGLAGWVEDLAKFNPGTQFKDAKWRSLDGSRNNRKKPRWGATFTNKLRIVKTSASIGDKMSGLNLPNPRTISNIVAAQPDGLAKNTYGRSSWMWAFGQAIDHDLAAETDLGNDEKVTFCKTSEHDAAKAAYDSLSQQDQNKSCFQRIEIPDDDVHFPTSSHMEFFRSPYNKNANNRRTYMNIITMWIDASFVYGSSDDAANGLRDMSPNGRGRLRASANNFLPIIDEATFGPHSMAAFVAGDIRVNENIILATVHTLFFREHNRVARLLWRAHFRSKSSGQCSPACSEEIFQRARAYVIALLQKIVYEDWLPELLGPSFFNHFVGKWKGYQSKVDPRLTMEFTVSAYRLGHTLLNDLLPQANGKLDEIRPSITLADAFFQTATDYVSDKRLISRLAAGLITQRAETMDSKIIGSVRNMLFGDPLNGEEAFDLVSLNLMRARDNGLPSYSQVQQEISDGKFLIGKGALRRKRDIKKISTDPATASELTTAYGSIDKVELFLGALAEDHFDETVGGKRIQARLGGTNAFIIADQFIRLRDGDRFYYENYLSPGLIAQVKSTTMANLLERNLGIRFAKKFRDASGKLTLNVFQAYEGGIKLPTVVQAQQTVQQVEVPQQMETTEQEEVGSATETAWNVAQTTVAAFSGFAILGALVLARMIKRGDGYENISAENV